jgi:uncharacterized membrane protein
MISANMAGGAGAAFLGALVESVEALTVVLAIGTVRGWRSALAGTCAAVMLLALIVVACGPAIALLPAAPLRAAVGMLTLLFGMRWLNKAVLRAAGLIPLHDEQAIFERTRAGLDQGPRVTWDKLAAAGAFQIVMLEGTEIVVIVASIGAGAGLLLPAAFGAGAAMLIVVALGVALHRPLSKIPENSLKLATGVLLSAFGTFWTGEGFFGEWPGSLSFGDGSLIVLVLLWAATAGASISLARMAAA